MATNKKGDKRILKYSVVSALMIFVWIFGFGVTAGYAQTKPEIKTLKSYHKIHVKAEGLDCTDCHTSTKKIRPYNEKF